MKSSEDLMSVVKFPYRYYFRKADVMYFLRDRISTYKKILKNFEDPHFKQLLKDVNYLHKKIAFKKGVIDLSEDEIAKRWVNMIRFYCRQIK